MDGDRINELVYWLLNKNLKMVVIKFKFRCRNFYSRLRSGVSRRIEEGKLQFRSLTYNERLNKNYLIDCLMEPMFWFVDNFAKYLGRVFVFCVIILTSAVVTIAYWLGLPYWWERNPYATVILVVLGHWLLANIVFHYYMGVSTPPGFPPHGATITEASSICKKCIAPKPPRTHHCSVCDRCILGMDHHCPWMNNCVGYLNSRFFYLYMVYMVVGVFFVITAGFDIGYVALWLNDTGGLIKHNDPDLYGHPMHLNLSGVLVPVKEIVEYDSEMQPREHILPLPIITEAQRITADPLKKKAVVFMAVTCVSVLIALGTLVINHGKNIARGETSIESHINISAKKKDRTFRNPYNFGRSKNWKLFLGLTNGRTFWKHVLLPSKHGPIGNGLTWRTIHDLNNEYA